MTNKSEVRELVKTVQSMQSNNSVVLICPQDFILNYIYYAHREAFMNWNAHSIYKNMDDALRQKNIFGINHISEFQPENNEHIIYVDAAASFTHPENQITETLIQTHRIEQQTTIPDIFNVISYRSLSVTP